MDHLINNRELVPVRNTHRDIGDSRVPNINANETIIKLADMMMSLQYGTVGMINQSNFRDVIPYAMDYTFSAPVDDEILEASKNIFAKNYIYDKILKRKINSIDLLVTFRFGIDSPHIFSTLGTLRPLNISYPYISPAIWKIIHNDCQVFISQTLPFIYGDEVTRCKFDIKVMNLNYKIITEYSCGRPPKSHHSFRGLINDLQENSKNEYLAIIYNHEIILFEINFTSVYRRYRIISAHSERFLPLTPQFLVNKSLLFEVLRIFTYLEQMPRRCLLDEN
jgi:hypothetical protein